MGETISIPKAEYEQQRQQIDVLTETVAQLKAQLAWFQRQVFGQKSERFIDPAGEVPELPGLQLPEPKEPQEEPVKVPEHQRRSQPRKGSCTLELPDSLERVDRIIDVPEAERTLPDGTPLTRIGEDTIEQLAHRPGEYYVLRTIRPKYADPTDPTLGVVQERAPGGIIPGAKFDPSFMAHLTLEKYGYHLPLYRIQEKLAERDIMVTRQLLSQTLISLGLRVRPITELMFQRLLATGAIYIDGGLGVAPPPPPPPPMSLVVKVFGSISAMFLLS